MSSDFRTDIPVNLATTSIRIILSGLVRLTFRSIFAAAAWIISFVCSCVKRFSTVIRKVSSGWICWASSVAVFMISWRVVCMTFWIGMTRRV